MKEYILKTPTLILIIYTNLIFFIMMISIGLLKVISTLMIFNLFEETVLLVSTILGSFTIGFILVINLEKEINKLKKRKKNG